MTRKNTFKTRGANLSILGASIWTKYVLRKMCGRKENKVDWGNKIECRPDFEYHSKAYGWITKGSTTFPLKRNGTFA